MEKSIKQQIIEAGIAQMEAEIVKQEIEVGFMERVKLSNISGIDQNNVKKTQETAETQKAIAELKLKYLKDQLVIVSGT